MSSPTPLRSARLRAGALSDLTASDRSSGLLTALTWLTAGCTALLRSRHAPRPMRCRAAPALAATLAACQTPDFERQPSSPENVLVVAHRTCWRQAAENSLEGLEACIRQGVDIAEVDVRRTRDGVLVLMHDPTVDRTTNGSGRVSWLTYAQLSGLRLKAGRGGAEAPMTSYRIPTLEEALRRADGRIMLEIDIKGSSQPVHAFLRKQGRTDSIVLGTDTGFDPRLKVRWRLSVEPRDNSVRRLRLPDGARPFAVSAHWNRLPDPDGAFARVRAEGGRIWSVTLTGKRDTPATWERYIRTGNCAIHTDRPDRLIQYLRERKARQSEFTPS